MSYSGRLKHEELDNMQKRFQELDANGDGFLTVEDIGGGRVVDPLPPDQDVRQEGQAASGES